MRPMRFTSGSGSPTLARWVLLLTGVGVTTAGFVGLVIAENRGRGHSPWWVVGLVGLVGVSLALGSPRHGSGTDD